MPHERLFLGRAGGLKVEKVRFHAPPSRGGRWSPVYRPAGARVVMPGEGRMELRTGYESLFADALTACFLDDGVAYQLGTVDARERSNVVLSAEPGASAMPVHRPALLSPRALLGLRLHWKALREGAADPGDTPALVRAAWQGAGIPCSTGAAGRARSILSASEAAGERHSLAEISEEARTSPFHLARGFRKATGLSIHQYRTRLRIAMALGRLEAGERDMAGLAHDLGFAHQSHFGEVFRRETGTTPGKVRAALAC